MNASTTSLLRRVTALRVPTIGIVCHPQPLIGEAVSRALVDGGALDGAWTLDSVNAAVGTLKSPAHVIILSEDLGSEDLDDVVETLRHRQLTLPVLMLQERPDVERVVGELERGASGVLTLDSPAVDLCASVRLSLRGGLVIPACIQQETLRLLSARAADRQDAHRKLGIMTPRERQVLLLLVDGVGRIEIAHRLGLSSHTARTHLERVKAKLGVRTQLEAAAEGRRLLSAEQIGPHGGDHRDVRHASFR
jgi:DNA-binding NarL/FixJ family response regulator